MTDTTATKLAVEVVNGNPAERILVIAPSYQDFGYWCRERDINPRAANIRYVHREYDLRGYSNAWYVDLGDPRCLEGRGVRALLEHLIAVRGFKNAEVTPEEP